MAPAAVKDTTAAQPATRHPSLVATPRSGSGPGRPRGTRSHPSHNTRADRPTHNVMKTTYIRDSAAVYSVMQTDCGRNGAVLGFAEDGEGR